ncbi:nucleotidyltransferase [Ornithinimicrobium sp. CNJ-824]|uniref:nucleotidyltransferase n=1 Tax=Ornithinimicrobium sp. CNJ-824 TaxID=1904966 RepID=UPI0011807B2E|nr:nucleotidyltransferase [Ornithinimicrobium sp. CNJ-824]
MKAFPGARVYVNGSVAHRDALTPLTDVDLGVVVPDPDGIYGPGKKGPTELREKAARHIRDQLRPTYGDLRVEATGRKRSILIKFNEPVSDRAEDFTADVIVAIDYPDGPGLLIPRWNGWDRSHPEEHTHLVRQAIKDSRGSYARVVRLLKRWNRAHGKPLCSWNVKAIALGCITTPTTQLQGLLTWFTYAVVELRKGETRDPAGVAPKPIKLNESMTRTQVVQCLEDALSILRDAVRFQEDGYPVLAADALARFFDDDAMLPRPDQGAVRRATAERFRARQASASPPSASALVRVVNESP